MQKENKIEKYKNKGELDLERIVNEYNGYVYKIIENMVSKKLNQEDIEEIISDTFFILWKNRNKLKDENLLSSYIAGITRNLVKEKIRNINFNVDISEYENVIQDFFRIDMICEQREKISIIKRKVNSMKKEDILIFNLYYYSSKSIKEISKMLNISEFSVKSRLYRIRKRINKELEKGGYTYEI